MQARAIFEAACRAKEEGSDPKPDIMVPLVGTVAELEDQVLLIRETAKDVFEEMKTSVDYRVGTMIEIPRAALLSDEIANTLNFSVLERTI